MTQEYNGAVMCTIENQNQLNKIYDIMHTELTLRWISFRNRGLIFKLPIKDISEIIA